MYVACNLRYKFVHIQRSEESVESLRIGVTEVSSISGFLYGCLYTNSCLHDYAATVIDI